MTAIAVFGYGNESRGDDAIGPRLLHALDALALPGVECIEDFQLQIEHALDLEGRDLALFLDAGEGTPEPFAFYEAKEMRNITSSSHAILPGSVLGVYRQVRGAAPPPAFVLCVRGEQWELGTEMGARAQANLAAALNFAKSLLAEPGVALWRARTTVESL
jgi:hydrogenase maturation protease